MRKLWIMSNSSYMEERVRLSKLKSLLMREKVTFCFVGWLRTSRSTNTDYDIFHAHKSIGGTISLGYILWSIKLFWFLIKKTKKEDCFYSMGLESAIPAYFVSKIRGNNYIFDNPDNFSTSFKLKGWIKAVVDKIEEVVARNSCHHILPSQYRVIKATPKDKFIANTPSRMHIQQARKLIANPKNNEFLCKISLEKRFKIYLNGRLVDDRGGDYISTAFDRLDPHEYCLVIVGDIKSDKFKSFISSTRLEIFHSNRIPPEVSLAAYFFCDVTIALYSPARQINKLAESNKWFDSIVMNTPFVSNNEVASLLQFNNSPLCNKVNYGDSDELFNVLSKLNKKNTLDINDELRDWDASVFPLVREMVFSETG